MAKYGNLIFGIVLLVLAVINLGFSCTNGTLSLRNIALDGSLIIFAISRFMMFGAPGLPIIRPMRTIALIGVIASYILPKA